MNGISLPSQRHLLRAMQAQARKSTRRSNAEASVNLAKRRTWRTTTVDQFNTAGLERVEYTLIDAMGIMAGPAGVLAAGADDGMASLALPQSFNLALQQPRQVNIEGANGVGAVYFFEPNTLPNGTMVLGAVDLNLLTRSTDTLIVADGDWDVPILQPDSPTFRRLCITTVAEAKSSESGSVGNAGYAGQVWPNVQLVPLGAAGLANAQGTTFTHALIASKFDRLPWGVSLTDLVNGTTGGVAYGPFFSEGRFSLHALQGDGSVTTVSLDHTPSAYNGSKIKVWDVDMSTGVGTALVYGAGAGKYTAATNVVTFGTATAAAHRAVIRYEW
jgi:hypothetical protein